MTVKKYIAKFVGYLLYTYIILINKTLQVKTINNTDKELFGKQNHIFAIWHKNTFTPFYLYRNKNIAMFVSDNLNGMILGNTGRMLGYDIIPLDKEHSKSTVIMKKKIYNGQNAIMAVDGPSGPFMHAKEGCHYLSDKSEVSTIAVDIQYDYFFTLIWRWDKYRIPAPFSRVNITFKKQYEQGTDWIDIEEMLGK